MKNYYYIEHTQENIDFCVKHKIPFIAHPTEGRIEVFANKERIQSLKEAKIRIWCEHEV